APRSHLPPSRGAGGGLLDPRRHSGLFYLFPSLRESWSVQEGQRRKEYVAGLAGERLHLWRVVVPRQGSGLCIHQSWQRLPGAGPQPRGVTPAARRSAEPGLQNAQDHGATHEPALTASRRDAGGVSWHLTRSPYYVKRGQATFLRRKPACPLFTVPST